ncbi:MAG: carbamoyl-phosphate synthase large subunit [Phycisphaeraceae bacterium]|nr:carbamoyl-phosphate synthase large subunit [Phycisphaeraceae bacterium]
MSIGRTFKESLQKGIRSMEVKRFGLGLDAQDKWLRAARAAWRWLGEHKAADLPRLHALAAKVVGQDSATPLQVAVLALDGPTAVAAAPAGLAAADAAWLDALRTDLLAALRLVKENDTAAGSIEWPIAKDKHPRKLNVPSQGRLYYIRYAFKLGWTIDQIFQATKIDPWFLDQIKQLVDFERALIAYESLDQLPRDLLFQAKQLGYSDAQLANLYFGKINPQTILAVRRHRKSLGVEPVYKLVDTCAAEFEAATPYYYSTYESPVTQVAAGKSTLIYDDEIRVTDRKKIVILGGGPNRIGQGIEFDYCCVQAAFAARELGFEAVMINSNPETVSTDYDTSDLLFFEPLTLEDVLNICERLNGAPLGKPGHLHGVIVQFGGQTPLNLAKGLEAAGVPIIGTSVDSIDLAESRERFANLIKDLGIRQPQNGIAFNTEQAIKVANQIGYPVLVRPSFVLGGRAMETVFDDTQLRHYIAIALGASDLPDQPILIDDFLADAIECDVDVVADYAPSAFSDQSRALRARSGDTVAGSDEPIACRALVAGVMEHIEEAGIHSGDSACAIPPYSLPPDVVAQLKDHSRKLAQSLGVRGLMNVQYAITRPSETQNRHEIFVLEVNPRASRTVPFVSKATGMSWARIAAKVMAGHQLADLGVTAEVTPTHTSVKESVFPFNKFPGVDVILGPEMRSTGEVMGIDPQFALAFAKSQMAANTLLPTKGKIFLSVRDSDKRHLLDLARPLAAMGFEVITTAGTCAFLAQQGVKTQALKKIGEGRPNAIDMIKNHELALIIITPTRKGISSDEGRLRATAVRFNVPMITTITGARAAVSAMQALRRGDWTVRALQDYFPAAAPTAALAAQC